MAISNICAYLQKRNKPTVFTFIFCLEITLFEAFLNSFRCGGVPCFFIQVIAWRRSIFFKISDAHFSLCISLTVIMFCSCNLRNFHLVAWIMSWSMGCNIDVAFGGKNWSFTLLYSTVEYDEACPRIAISFSFQMASYGLTSSIRFQILLMSSKHFCLNNTLQIIDIIWCFWSSLGLHVSILPMLNLLP